MKALFKCMLKDGLLYIWVKNMKLGYWKVERVANHWVTNNYSPDALESFVFLILFKVRILWILSRGSATFDRFHCVNTKNITGYCKITDMKASGHKSSQETGNYCFHQSFPIETVARSQGQGCLTPEQCCSQTFELEGKLH